MRFAAAAAAAGAFLGEMCCCLCIVGGCLLQLSGRGTAAGTFGGDLALVVVVVLRLVGHVLRCSSPTATRARGDCLG